MIGIAGAGALAASDDHSHVHPDQAPSEPAAAYAPKVFSSSQLATVGALCETILPRTDSPGALDAKVHELIDENLALRKAEQPVWIAGLAEVDAISKRLSKKSYLDLDDSNRVAVMMELEAKSKFFTTLKDATVENYYSTREGLMVELGWDGAKPLAKFEGCTHPEHQL